MNPAALLSLLAEQQEQIIALRNDNQQLRASIQDLTAAVAVPERHSDADQPN